MPLQQGVFMKSRIIRGCAAILLSLLAPLALAQLTESPDHLDKFLYPQNGLSSADEAFVMYADNCGRPHPDARRRATVSREQDAWVVDIYLVMEESEVCFAALMPDNLFSISLGNLPKGYQPVRRRLHLRQADGSYLLVYTSSASFNVGDTPNPSVSGAWYDPSASGTGLFINLLPVMQGDFEPQVVVYLAVVDPAGAPVWFTGVGKFVDAKLFVNLRQGGSNPAMRTLTFDYKGCGRGQMGYVDTPAWSAALSQLTTVNGLASCRPPQYRIGF
jgi:hypothetical protein